MCMKRTKQNRVQRHQENLLKRTKNKLLRSNLEEMSPKGKAPAMVAKDVKAQKCHALRSCS